MIEYVEVRSKTTREIIGIVDGTKSIIWHSVYYGVGDFEIYAVASKRHVELLKEGNYITRPYDVELGIIESVASETNEDGTMLIVTGRFAKSILDRRHIYKLSGTTNTPTILRGSVESAARALVANNAISCSFDSKRNIPELELGALASIPATIVDDAGNPAERQVSYENLLEYTDGLLQEYKLGAIVTIDDTTGKLKYSVYKGADRSADNTEGNEPIIFSQEFDNLAESRYLRDETLKKTAALIGGEGEGLERVYSLIEGNEVGIERRETWVDASGVNKTYQEEGTETEKTYTDAEYKALLDAEGKRGLAKLVTIENFEAMLNVNGGVWRLNEDYFLGDIVTFQDNTLGQYANVRIAEINEVQDENGYSVEPVFSYE